MRKLMNLFPVHSRSVLLRICMAAPLLCIFFLSGCGGNKDPNFPDQIELNKGSGSVSIPPGRNVTVRSTSPETGYRVRFDHQGGNAFFYAIGFHPKTGYKIMLEMLRVDAASSEAEKQKQQVEIQWSLDGKCALLRVDGQPQALLDFENERGMSRSGGPEMAGAWSKKREVWNEKLLEGF